jgi:hypothetical protein
VVFSTWQDKAAWLDGSAWADARAPYVREAARRIALPHDPNDFHGMALDAYELVQHRVRYISDPASEEFSDAETTLRQGYGDCDDKARLLVALLRSMSPSFEAHIRPVLDADGGFAHVQVVARFPGSYRVRGFRAGVPALLAGPGGWLTAEVILRDAHLGDELGDVPTRALS